MGEVFSGRCMEVAEDGNEWDRNVSRHSDHKALFHYRSFQFVLKFKANFHVHYPCLQKVLLKQLNLKDLATLTTYTSLQRRRQSSWHLPRCQVDYAAVKQFDTLYDSLNMCSASTEIAGASSVLTSTHFDHRVSFASMNSFKLLKMASRSQWPRGLKREVSSLARKLGSLVRIPLKAWMSACAFILYFVLSCVQATALRRADH
jgi:hypothetical protein